MFPHILKLLKWLSKILAFKVINIKGNKLTGKQDNSQKKAKILTQGKKNITQSQEVNIYNSSDQPKHKNDLIDLKNQLSSAKQRLTTEKYKRHQCKNCQEFKKQEVTKK